MPPMNQWLDRLAEATPWMDSIVVAGNPLWCYVRLVIALLVSFLVGRVARMVLHKLAVALEARRQRMLAVAAQGLAKCTGFFAFALGLHSGVQFLTFPAKIELVVAKVAAVLWVWAIAYMAYCLVTVVDCWLRTFSNKTASRIDDMLTPLVTKVLRTTIVILALAQMATIVSGTPPTSIIAGLGVGGLAIGLAGQDTIKNIFGSVMIFGDRPFELGDEIIVDGTSGTVESVGFRSTRYRTGAGHVVTIPNGDLANKAITNVSRRRNLSRTLQLPLPVDLSRVKMERALDIVRTVLADHEGQLPSNPPRVFFSDIAPTSLTLTAQYWFHPADGWKFAALNERVNLEILRRFQAEEIPLAMPTIASLRPPDARARLAA